MQVLKEVDEDGDTDKEVGLMTQVAALKETIFSLRYCLSEANQEATRALAEMRLSGEVKSPRYQKLCARQAAWARLLRSCEFNFVET